MGWRSVGTSLRGKEKFNRNSNMIFIDWNAKLIKGVTSIFFMC
jgi:hypothetical protein